MKPRLFSSMKRSGFGFSCTVFASHGKCSSFSSEMVSYLGAKTSNGAFCSLIGVEVHCNVNSEKSRVISSSTGVGSFTSVSS